MSHASELRLVTTDTADPAPLPTAPPVWLTGHDVQFYDDEDFLVSTVAAFLLDGLAAGQPLVVIATSPHRRAFVEGMEALRPSRETGANGEIVWLDARDTLAAFMEGGLPNAELFTATVGNVFAKILANRSYLVVRAYGEMVDILWKDGNVDGAIALEQLWNGLAVKYSFNLLCAYSMGNFFKESHVQGFRAICDSHRHVSPTEAYLLDGEADRLKQITLLQQRSRALEAEVAHRKELESALRETLAHRRRVEDELRRREAELRDILENGLEPIHCVGPDGIIKWVNAAECHMLGYSRDEMVGRHIAEFHADPSVIADMLQRLTAGEELRNYEARLACKDGSIRHVLVNSNVLRLNGEFLHTRCFTRDITHLRSANTKS